MVNVNFAIRIKEGALAGVAGKSGWAVGKLRVELKFPAVNCSYAVNTPQAELQLLILGKEMRMLR